MHSNAYTIPSLVQDGSDLVSSLLGLGASLGLSLRSSVSWASHALLKHSLQSFLGQFHCPAQGLLRPSSPSIVSPHFSSNRTLGEQSWCARALSAFCSSLRSVEPGVKGTYTMVSMTLVFVSSVRVGLVGLCGLRPHAPI